MKISEEYRAQQKELHEDPGYGQASLVFAHIVDELMIQFNLDSVLDYGAGKRHLHTKLEEFNPSKYTYFAYDPAFPEYGESRKADLVCCIDVLEHIEPEFLENVLSELSDVTTRYGVLTVHTGPAQKTLRVMPS